MLPIPYSNPLVAYDTDAAPRGFFRYRAGTWERVPWVYLVEQEGDVERMRLLDPSEVGGQMRHGSEITVTLADGEVSVTIEHREEEASDE